MDNYGTPTPSPDAYSIDDMDAAQFYGLVYIALITMCLIAFIIREKCNAAQDARSHPFHQQNAQHTQDQEEMAVKKAIAAEMEYMSAIDFGAYAE